MKSNNFCLIHGAYLCSSFTVFKLSHSEQQQQQLYTWFKNINDMNKIEEIISLNMDNDENNDWNNYTNNQTKKEFVTLPFYWHP